MLLIGSLTRPGDRNGEAIWLFIVSLLGVTAVSVFVPAIGKVGDLGTGYVDIITEIRSGHWSSFTYDRSDGIITFPSFHTVLAIILTYVVRHHWWALVFVAPLNALLILSTPTVGGHYLVDLLGELEDVTWQEGDRSVFAELAHIFDDIARMAAQGSAAMQMISRETAS